MVLSSTLVLILHCPFSFVGPYIFLNILLSHVRISLLQTIHQVLEYTVKLSLLSFYHVYAYVEILKILRVQINFIFKNSLKEGQKYEKISET